MRKCLRCENEMVENLEVKVSNGGYGIDVREKGVFKNAIEKIKCAVCPECGYTETYIENPDKIKELIENNDAKLSTNPSENNKPTELKRNISYSETNCLTLVGKIAGEKNLSYEKYGEKFYTFDLSVPRLSGCSDIIPITISEKRIINKLLVDDEKILVKGQFKTFLNRKNRLELTVLAKEIEEYQETEKINEVVLIGKVCIKPRYRQAPSGREFTDLLLAVYGADNKSDYIPAIAWGKNAILCQNLEVGAQIKIIGRVKALQYEKNYKDGTSEKSVTYEVSISSLEIIGGDVTYE